jgi:plastocyanin
MVSTKVIAGIVAVITFSVIVYLFVAFAAAPENTVRVIDETNTITGSAALGQEHFVEVSDSGFSPNTLTISKGDTVTFVALDGGHWPATDIHPTHTVYPGADIGNCFDEIPDNEFFDACRMLDEGETYSFTFNEVGEWHYHDHRQASMTGVIVVE